MPLQIYTKLPAHYKTQKDVDSYVRKLFSILTSFCCFQCLIALQHFLIIQNSHCLLKNYFEASATQHSSYLAWPCDEPYNRSGQSIEQQLTGNQNDTS